MSEEKLTPEQERGEQFLRELFGRYEAMAIENIRRGLVKQPK